jgi:uncharacterized membrane protein YjgN (DUF898 family)
MEETTIKRNYDEGFIDPNDSKETWFLTFFGQGMELFKINIVNMLLTLVTLGLYYPWAKANKLKYVYSQTEFKGSRFSFLGTGKEMFRGYIKVYAFIIVFYAVFFYAQSTGEQALIIGCIGVLYLLLFLFIPFAIHSAMKYRMSRSSWRSIRFGYRGKAMEFFKKYIVGLILTVLTCGIYSSWFSIDMYRYVYGNMRFGDVEMKYKGDGGDLFILNLKGMILSVLTCYIYIFWFQKELFEYHIKNTEFIQNGKSIPMTTRVTGADFAELQIVNILLMVFTLGLATPWVYCRTLEFYFLHTMLIGTIDENALQQTEAKYTNATGEDILDQTDMDLGILDF